MLLSVRPLNAVASVNIYEAVDAVQLNQGDGSKVYFQLIDEMQDREAHGFNPAGRRYMPASGATLQVTLQNINNAKQITRAAIMAFPSDDRSIWYLQLLSTDTLAGTCDMLLTLTEGAVVTHGRAKAVVLISTVDC